MYIPYQFLTAIQDDRVRELARYHRPFPARRPARGAHRRLPVPAPWRRHGYPHRGRGDGRPWPAPGGSPAVHR
jgi:hypothetical protein